MALTKQNSFDDDTGDRSSSDGLPVTFSLSPATATVLVSLPPLLSWNPAFSSSCAPSSSTAVSGTILLWPDKEHRGAQRYEKSKEEPGLGRMDAP